LSVFQACCAPLAKHARKMLAAVVALNSPVNAAGKRWI
jgi:hypothetical protein